MSATPQPPPPGVMNLGDIYFIIFRHKWKIIICSTAGILAAIAVFLSHSSPYQSEAKLFIKYVLETKLPSSGIGSDPQIQKPDSRGGMIINNEVEILTSLDVANQVADAIGPDRILAKIGGGNDRTAAAAFIKNNLKVEVPKDSSVLQISFQHPDPQLVQPVLSRIISSYQDKHQEIHRQVGVWNDVLTRERDALSAQVAQTELELQKAKNKVGVMSLEDAKKAYTDQISKISQELYDAAAELAELQVLMPAKPLMPVNPETTATNLGVPVEKVTEYKSVIQRLSFFRQKEFDLTTKEGYREDSSRVKAAREQIATTEEIKKKLEEENPKLADIDSSSQISTGPAATWSADQSRNFAATARVAQLQAKTNILTSQLEKIVADASAINEMEAPITRLQRKKELEESQLRFTSSSLDQARFDETMGAGKAPNISIDEAPTPPFKSPSNLKKTLAKILFAGIGGGFGLAFLIEMLLDHSLRRPAEVEGKLRLPLIISIPDTSWDSRFKLPRIGKRPKLLGNGRLQLKAPESETTAEQNGVVAHNGNGEIAPWEPSHQLRPFYEALRDRLVTNFEVRNLTHKPKLVAVTGCSKGSGVTSTAAGLAATLSETGDGNVLLVDMNLDNGAAHPFFKGKPACNLADLLEFQKDEKRDSALVRENLYMATEGKNSDKLPRILPKRFTNLVPKLKASDYDYIIFDMPTVSQTSVTPRLAGFMDMVLLVVESEKTDREIAKRASALLQDSKAYVNVVFNKTRTYVPAKLHQEFLEGA